MEEKNCYDAIVTEYKAIASVGNELKEKIAWCKNNEAKYEEKAKELEAAGDNVMYYREWAENARLEAKYWAKAEELFRTTVLS